MFRRAMNDLELRNLLQELAVLRADGEPVVTLYLDTRWTDEQQRERARVFVREEAKRELDAHAAHPQREALARTLARVEATVLERLDQQDAPARGLAIFGCEALNLWRVLELPQAVGTKLCTGMRPQLLPLARLLDDVEPAIIAVVHASGARVYETALGGLVAQATIEGPVPRGGYARGGFEPRPALGRQAVPGNERGGEGFQYERADKNQRVYKNAIQRNLAAAAAFVTQRFDQRPCHLVLVGPREKTAAFERELPERARGRIIACYPEPPISNAGPDRPGVRDQLLEQTLTALAAKEREQEERNISLALGQAKSGGNAVLGPDEVVLAVNERRVLRLILEADFAKSGWMCRNCDAIGVSRAERCSYCQGELAWVKELGEEIAGRVLADDGEVEVVPHDQRLHSFHGVAAMLRQARGGFGMNEGRGGGAPA
jgi:hypothetical protein